MFLNSTDRMNRAIGRLGLQRRPREILGRTKNAFRGLASTLSNMGDKTLWSSDQSSDNPTFPAHSKNGSLPPSYSSLGRGGSVLTTRTSESAAEPSYVDTGSLFTVDDERNASTATSVPELDTTPVDWWDAAAHSNSKTDLAIHNDLNFRVAVHHSGRERTGIIYSPARDEGPFLPDSELEATSLPSDMLETCHPKCEKAKHDKIASFDVSSKGDCPVRDSISSSNSFEQLQACVSQMQKPQIVVIRHKSSVPSPRDGSMERAAINSSSTGAPIDTDAAEGYLTPRASPISVSVQSETLDYESFFLPENAFDETVGPGFATIYGAHDFSSSERKPDFTTPETDDISAQLSHANQYSRGHDIDGVVGKTILNAVARGEQLFGQMGIASLPGNSWQRPSAMSHVSVATDGSYSIFSNHQEPSSLHLNETLPTPAPHVNEQTHFAATPRRYTFYRSPQPAVDLPNEQGRLDLAQYGEPGTGHSVDGCNYGSLGGSMTASGHGK